jgi:large subunit ribosomal protein L2
MGIRIYRPTTPGRRKSSVNDYAELHGVTTPHKPLLKTIKQQAGRNFSGKITVRHRGAGNKRFYRQVDFIQSRFDVAATVLGIQYDPNRSSHIALIEFPDKEKRYIIAPSGLKAGQTVLSSNGPIEIATGNRTKIEFIPTGVPVHNIELQPGRGAAIVRSAGNAATIMSIEGDYALVKMPSGEIRKILKACRASIGQVSNIDHGNIRWGKAGRMRWRNRRPSVRGKAMNPVDHPHGGGEGNQPIGMKAPKTPWGKKALGVKTRRSKKFSNRLIISRRPK